jgi:diguanylate cyclase (GGDEF)-like protein/PAS domain S-box-containing protein
MTGMNPRNAPDLAPPPGPAPAGLELLRLREELAGKTAYWEAAMAGSGLAIWDWDLERGRLFCSPQWKAMLGYGSPDIGGGEDEAAALVHPEDRQAREQSLQAHLDGLLPEHRSEHRMRCQDGRYKWVLEHGRVIQRSASGRPLRLVGTLADTDRQHRDQAERERSEALFRAVFNSMFQFIGIVEPDGRVIAVNDTALDFAGITGDEVIGRPCWETPWWRHSGEARSQLREAVQRAASGQFVRQEVEISGLLDRRLTVDFSLKPVHDDRGRVALMIAEGRDISERLRAEQALRESEQLFRQTFDNAPIGIALVSPDGRWLAVNRALCRIVGYSEAELLARTFQDITHPDDLDADLHLLQQVLAGTRDGYSMEKRYFHKDGHSIDIQLDVTLKRDPEGRPQYFISQIQDISERRRYEDALTHEAHHDALTGLPNRRLFEDVLNEKLYSASLDDSPHALFYLDLDRFKLINDTCGHQAGDRVLIELSRLLSQRLSPDDLLARLGGDEFAVITCGVAEEDAPRLAAELIRAVGDYRFRWEGRSFQLGLSVGVALFDNSAQTGVELLKRADTACYIAKQSGRNRVQVYHRSDEEVQQAHSDMDWASRIEQALDENRIELFGQRIVSLDDARQVGLEVLMRLREADGTLVHPPAFMQAAIRYGLTGKLDRWIVQQALQLLHGLARGPLTEDRQYLTLNLSGSSIADPDFRGLLLRTLDETPTASYRIAFEITEATAFGRMSAVRELMQTLRTRGHRVLLDDFGSGFTSFECLKTLEVDGLKIDQSYTRNLASDRVNQAIVESICRISQRMGLQVIAEGVEDETTREALMQLGVRHAQGHLFHRAVPLREALVRT